MLAVWLGLPGATRAELHERTAQRGLVSPSSEQPARTEPGGIFSLVVNSATALTPPPGIQEPRAHRAFAVWACADGIPLAAPARLCFPLAVEDLRPLASHSLSYRVDVALPQWVAPGRYDLGVRFPGGSAHVPGGLQVGPERSAGCQATWAPEPVPALAGTVTAPCALVARVHLGGSAGLAEPGDTSGYPMPTERGEFGDGVVLLVPLRAGESRSLRRAPDGQGPAMDIEATPRPGRSESVELTARGARAGAQVFWRLSAWQGARGPTASARYRGTSRAGQASAAAIGADGALQRAQLDLTRLTKAPRNTALGCRVGDGRGDWPAAGLLFLVLSRKLGPRRRQRRVPPGPVRE